MSDKERGSQSVHRALGVLQCFTVESPTLSLTEVSAKTGLTMPTAHRMVKALQREDYLVQVVDNGHYSLGPAVMRLARVILARDNHDELVVAAMPVLERLRLATGETVGLHAPFGRERVCVVELASRQPIRMATGVGQAYPLHAGAAGKALLAWQPDEAVDRYLETELEQVTDSTIDDPSSLREALRAVRERGYATSHGETVAGASALAAPVFSAASSVAGVVNVTGPADRWTVEHMDEHRETVLAATREISLLLGYRAEEAGHPALVEE